MGWVNRPRLLAMIVLVTGVGLTIAAGWFVEAYYQRTRQQQIELQTDGATYAVKVALDRVAIAVQAVRALYASDWVTAEQFDRFAGTLASAEPIRSLSFYRRVTDAERADYERRFDGDPAARLGIWQYDAGGNPVRAPERPVHFVVESGHLLTGNVPAFGFDIASLPDRRSAIDRAISDMRLVVGGPTRLLDTGVDGVVFYAPARDRSGSVIGIAAASLTFGELATIARLASGVSDIRIAMSDAPDGPATPAAAAPPAGVNQRTFEQGSRLWTVTVTPAPAAGGFAQWSVVLIIGAGLATTLAVLAYLSNRAKTAEVTSARARLRGMLDGLGPLAWLLDADGTIINANRAAIAAFGRAKDDSGTGRAFWELPLNGGSKEQTERLRQAVAAAARAEDVRFDLKVEEDGTRRVVDLWLRPLIATHGDPVHLVASAVDVTDRYEGEETQRLLMRELDHRMKNTLQVIQAIIRRTARSHMTVPRFEESLLGRVNAMSRAHELLAEERWLGADIRTIVEQETRTFDAGHMIEVAGPRRRLNPKAALSIALAMHELGTNASKYGALSTPRGRVSVDWRVDGSASDGRLILSWTELGGPAVEPPAERGFGSMLIERSIAYELDGEATVDYRREGVVCVISIPLRTIAPFVGEPAPPRPGPAS